MRGTFRLFICLLLPIVALAAGAPGEARAQQPEKRIALVVGNGAYAKSPLATTANDAGLIAQTLQAAGFDVVGARDLDGDTLRKSFRDFIQKAQASGPGTVAMVYLAGYGVQLAGENYFIPVDSSISRDTDIPTEGLRIGDYMRQLASIPLKANIIVLDAARAQPFIEGGQPIASGLALVEPEANMLIAFNAAPGTVAPEEPGTIRHLCAVAGGDDPHRRPAAARGVRARPPARQRGQQGRPGALERAEDLGAVLVLRARARCAAAGHHARPGRRDPEQADPRSRRAGRLCRRARARHAAGL